MQKLLIICPLVFIAGFIDAVAGGGGLVSLPAYMLAGLPVHQSIATNKMSSCMGTTIATTKYILNGFIPWKLAPFAIAGALAGSTTGANIALMVDAYYFKILMLFIIPVTTFYVLKTKSFSEEDRELAFAPSLIMTLIIAFLVGIYDGFYGPGTETFLILLLTGIVKMSLKKANGLCKIINLSTNIAALTVYLLNGKVVIFLGLTAGLFNIAGNYLGAVSFSKDGAKFTRPVILIVLTIFFMKLIMELLHISIF